MRADARSNRDLLLLAARDVLVERGPDAPLDEVARRAGVGIATLYRRFPDRAALLHAVALDILTRVADQARQALAEEPTPFQALARYMHRALDLRIAAVMPSLVGRVSLDADQALLRARQSAVEPVERMLEAAQADGSLRPNIAFGDVGLLLVRLSRPLPGGIPRDLDDRLAHRHLDLLLDGLRRLPGAPADLPLGGPLLTLTALRRVGADARSAEHEQTQADGDPGRGEDPPPPVGLV